MYYFHIQNNEIVGKGQARLLNAENIEVSQEVYDESEKYIYQDGKIVLDPEYEAKQAQKEAERVAMLSLTRGDVFRGLLLARGVTRLQLRGMIEGNEQLTEVQKEMALIDFDEALNFYRGNALIDTVGLALGIEPAQLDCFFKTNDYTCLLPKVEPEEEIIPEPNVDNPEAIEEEKPVIDEVITE